MKREKEKGYRFYLYGVAVIEEFEAVM